MTRTEILDEIRKYFRVDELVCNHALAGWGERAWQFLDTDYLHVLLIVRRDIIRRPMYCNNHSAGIFQRGIRCNMCSLVRAKRSAYLSPHVFGKAGDFSIQDMSAEEARRLIKDRADLLPCNVRVEGGVSWLHIDVLPQAGITEKVYEFRV